MKPACKSIPGALQPAGSWPVVGLTLALAGCSSAPTHYHALAQIHQSAAPAADTGGCTSCTILLAHVGIPAEVDRMQLLVHQDTTRLKVYESERWAVSLRDQLPAILIGDLRERLPGAAITGDRLLTGTQAPLRLNVDVEELDAVAGKEATVRVRWEVSAADRSTSQVGERVSRQPLSGADVDEVVLAWSRGLAEVSSAIAASIRCCPGAAGSAQ